MENDADNESSGAPEGYTITLKTRMFGELWRGEFTIDGAKLLLTFPGADIFDRSGEGPGAWLMHLLSEMEESVQGHAHQMGKSTDDATAQHFLFQPAPVAELPALDEEDDGSGHAPSWLHCSTCGQYGDLSEPRPVLLWLP